MFKQTILFAGVVMDLYLYGQILLDKDKSLILTSIDIVSNLL